MQRNILSLLFVSLVIFNTNANPTPESLKIKALQAQLRIIDDSMQSLKNELIFFKRENEHSERKLNESIEAGRTTIEHQAALIDGFHVIYVIITLLAAIILPIVTWFLGIRPSQKALKEFQKSTDRKFEDYVKRMKEKEITENISLLEDSDELYERITIDSLIKLTYSDLNFDQRYNLSYVISRKVINEQNKKGIRKLIQTLILFKKSEEKIPIANDFVKNCSIKSNDLNIKNDGIKYLIAEKSIDFSNKIELFSNMVFNSTTQCGECVNLFLQVVSLNSHFITAIINRKKLIDAIIAEERKKIIIELQDSKYDIIRDKINNSYLVTTYPIVA